jgi:hypothetical protein
MDLRWKMGKGRLVDNNKVTKTMKDTYWCQVNGSPVDKVSLRKSREVKQENIKRTRLRPNYGERYKVPSARINPLTDGVLDKGIQIHRLWFQFLKLALELETLGVTEIVTKQGFWDRSAPSGGQGVGMKFRTKDTLKFKIKKDVYEGWDLPQVLNDPFDTWWKTHSHLFEGYPPSFTKPNDNHNPDDFLFIRIDKTSKLEDIRDFVTTQVKEQLTGEPKFKIGGYPRPDVLQNGYNAIVLTLKGWSNKEICEPTNDNIYLRATDSRSGGSRLTVPTSKTGKKNYPIAVSKQRNVGIHHLINVMSGKFGDLPKEGIK